MGDRMQKVKNLFCENRGRKLAVLLLGAFGYALLTALCSQIEQFGATAWSRTLAPVCRRVSDRLCRAGGAVGHRDAETDVQAARKPKTLLHMGRGAAVFCVLYADAAHRVSGIVFNTT